MNPPPLPRIVEEKEQEHPRDEEAEAVEKYAAERPDEDLEPVEAAVDASGQESSASLELPESKRAKVSFSLGFEAPRTPTDTTPLGRPVSSREVDVNDGQMLDDTAEAETQSKLPRVAGGSPTSLTSPTTLFSPHFAGDIRMVEMVDDEPWEQSVANELYGDGELGDDLLLDYEVGDCADQADKPPDLTPDELRKVEDEAGFIEIERLLQMGVMEEPSPQRKQDGTLLSTQSVFDWRFREGKWKRRCRFVAREFKGGMVGDASTLAPTSSMALVRLILVLHVVFRWSLSVLDVIDAFLLVPQQELVLVDKPDWWSDAHQGRRWVLRRCLPGQRNAASRWFQFCQGEVGELRICGQ